MRAVGRPGRPDRGPRGRRQPALDPGSDLELRDARPAWSPATAGMWLLLMGIMIAWHGRATGRTAVGVVVGGLAVASVGPMFTSWPALLGHVGAFGLKQRVSFACLWIAGLLVLGAIPAARQMEENAFATPRPARVPPAAREALRAGRRTR